MRSHCGEVVHDGALAAIGSRLQCHRQPGLRKVCRIGFEVGLSSRKGLWYSMVLSDFVLLRQPGSSEYPSRVPLFYAVVTEVVSFDTSIG
jgi:hypothetical protein